MTISKELFLAILSMDAYNRGYGAGITDGGENDPDGLGVDGSIGTASIKTFDELGVSQTEYAAWQAAGFYAIAYDTEYGTIISYRGTDHNGLAPDPVKGGSDVINGWVAGAGETTSQTQLAIDFYRAVFGLDSPGDSLHASGAQPGILTGHSLGGGLAGFLSTLTGTEGVGFDHMPFGEVALVQLALESERDQILYSPNLGSFSAEHTNGEALAYVRSGTAQALLALLPPSLLHPINWYFGLGLDLDTDASRDLLQRAYNARADDLQNPSEGHESYSDAGLLGKAKLHSVDYLIALKFADDNQLLSWQSLGKELYNAYFDEALAGAAGADKWSGVATDAGKLAKALSYSALEGRDGLVFGNTGIRAMFDDLTEFGAIADTKADALDALDASVTGAYQDPDTSLRQSLTDAIVQFAGEMALRKVETDDTETTGPRQGIVSFSKDGAPILDQTPGMEAATGDLMLVSLSQTLWDEGKADGVKTTAPQKLTDWIEKQLADQIADYMPQAGLADQIVQVRMVDLLEATYGPGRQNLKWKEADDAPVGQVAGTGLTEKYISSVEFVLADGATAVRLAGDVDLDEGSAALVLATEGSDTIRGTDRNEVYVLSGGDDEVTDQGGADIFFGGLGSDTYTKLHGTPSGQLVAGGKYGDIIFGLHADKNPFIAAPAGDAGDEFSAEDFRNWLFGQSTSWLDQEDDTNEVIYSVRLGQEEDSGIADDGLKLIDIGLADLGISRVIEVKTAKRDGGAQNTTQTDALFGVQQLTLSERADEALLDDDALKAPILIDFGGFANDRPVTSADYDFLSLAGLTQGVTMVSGVVNAEIAEPDRENLRQEGVSSGPSLSLISSNGAQRLLDRGNGFDARNEDTPLTLTGFEKLQGSDFGDTLIFGSNDLSAAVFSGEMKAEHPLLIGDINAGNGNDIVITFGAEVGATRQGQTDNPRRWAAPRYARRDSDSARYPRKPVVPAKLFGQVG